MRIVWTGAGELGTLVVLRPSPSTLTPYTPVADANIPPTGTSYLTMCTCWRRSTASVVSAAQRYSIRQINTLDKLNRAKHRQLFQKRTRASVSADCRLPRNFLARLVASAVWACRYARVCACLNRLYARQDTQQQQQQQQP